MLDFLQARMATIRSACDAVFVNTLAAGLVALAVFVSPLPALAKAPASIAGIESTVTLADLPKQAVETHALVLSGGPFAYDKDGVVFGNREKILPAQKRGFYREYTVKTPHARNRGAKRIVCGGSQPTAPEACYYSDDHYATFKRIVK